MAELSIGGKRVGHGRAFLIAEAGVNHQGREQNALEMVDAAAHAGADAFKLQTFDPDLLAAPDARKAPYQVKTTGEKGSQLDMLRALVLSPEAHARIRDRAIARGLVFLSTPFDEASADLLETLDVPAFKVSSGDLTNASLLAHIARKKRPILLSTGMSTLDEVARALETIRSNGDPEVALFHCVSSYPAEAHDANLRAMATLRDAFHKPTGWSDHTRGIAVAIAAAALGAELIEKHFTLDRTLPGPDHAASLEPKELTALVRGVRDAEAALGDGVKAPRPCELAVAAVARRSLHFARALTRGTTIGRKDLVALRPAGGLAPGDEALVIGRRLERDVARHEIVKREDVGLS